MSDELLDRLDAWGRSESFSSRAGGDAFPMVRLMGEVRRVRRTRAALKAGVVVVVLAMIVTLAAVLLSRTQPKPVPPVVEPPVRAIDR